jgi:hypothetical protein
VIKCDGRWPLTGGAADQEEFLTEKGQVPEEKVALDEACEPIHSGKTTPEAVETVCIPEPMLPAHLKDDVGGGGSDWDAGG